MDDESIIRIIDVIKSCFSYTVLPDENLLSNYIIGSKIT